MKKITDKKEKLKALEELARNTDMSAWEGVEDYRRKHHGELPPEKGPAVKTSIASEKEKILEGLDQKYADRGNYPYYAEIRDSISHSLDHIASVARQEGREELLGEINSSFNKLDSPRLVYKKGTRVLEVDMYDFFKEIAKLTGKGETKVTDSRPLECDCWCHGLNGPYSHIYKRFDCSRCHINEEDPTGKEEGKDV